MGVAACGGGVTAAPERARAVNYLYTSLGDFDTDAAPLLKRPDIDGVQVVVAWAALEKAKGSYDFSAVEQVLGQVRALGKKLFVQVQDRFFEPPARLPSYVLTDPEYAGGTAAQTDDNGPTSGPTGAVAMQWNPAVQQRFQQLLKALAHRFDGRIAGINLPETAIDIDIDAEKHRDVDLEGFARCRFADGGAVEHRAVVLEEIGVQVGELVQVPPLRDLGAQVAEGDVLPGEDVHVVGEAAAFEGVPSLAGEGAGRDPHARGGGAETEAGQIRPEGIPLVALGFRHREHHQHPAVLLGCPGVLEDSDITLGEGLEGRLGQRVAGRLAVVCAQQHTAPLEPGDRRADGLRFRAEIGHQGDHRRGGQPVALGASAQAENGDDQVGQASVPATGRRWSFCRHIRTICEVGAAKPNPAGGGVRRGESCLPAGRLRRDDGRG
ncbi:hypothetical protein NS506_05929 [Nocardia seriolae]|uniref:Glycoside hydrolase family 42 N-terminal domain-containing protein n=1 Tax=Nocardia seriolae TaxID=37332 RepID=A0ABC8B150_9NOCA|nr:hypothetical protein NS506_05929 [Nocardia seriolae]